MNLNTNLMRNNGQKFKSIHFSKRFNFSSLQMRLRWNGKWKLLTTVLWSKALFVHPNTYWMRFSVPPSDFCFVSLAAVMQVYYIILLSHSTVVINYDVPNIFRMGFACNKKFHRRRFFLSTVMATRNGTKQNRLLGKWTIKKNKQKEKRNLST